MTVLPLGTRIQNWQTKKKIPEINDVCVKLNQMFQSLSRDFHESLVYNC